MAADPVLRFMVQWFAKHDVPPTVRQVWKAAQLEVSRKTVRSAVQQPQHKIPRNCRECPHHNVLVPVAVCNYGFTFGTTRCAELRAMR
jgi:hypothetical protein